MIRIICLLILISCSGQVAGQSAQILLNRGIYLENVDGSLEEAMVIYDSVATYFATSRPQAALALLRLGVVHEKLGDQRASYYFQEVVDMYPEQHNTADEATSRLSKYAGKSIRSVPESGLVVYRKLADLEDVYGSVSPNGKYISYVNWENGNLAAYDVQQKISREITTEGTWEGQGQYPDMSVWSPDSKRLAYLWFTGDGRSQMRVIDPTTGQYNVVAQAGKGEFYWPYQWTDGNLILAELIRKPHDLLRLVLIDPSSATITTVRKLRDNDDPSSIHGASLSPDGQYLALTTEGAMGVRKVEIYPADDPVSDALSRFDLAYGQVLWSHDGSNLFYASRRNNGHALYRRPISNGLVGEVDELVLQNLHDHFRPSAIDPDEGNLYYTSTYVESTVMRAAINWEDGGFRSMQSLINSDREIWSAVSSPDGRQVAMCRAGSNTDNGSGTYLVIHDLETGNETDYNFNSVHIKRPPAQSILEWTTDGQYLIAGFTEYSDEGSSATHGFIRIDPSTGSYARFETPAASTAKVVQSGDEVIYYQPERGFVQRNFSTGTEELILAGLADVSVLGMTLVDQGNRIIYFDRPTGDDHVRLMILDLRLKTTSELWHPDGTGKLMEEFPPLWSASGNGVLVASANVTDNSIQYYLISIENKRSATFGSAIQIGPTDRMYQRMDPDGGHVLFVRQIKRASAWSVQNIR